MALKFLAGFLVAAAVCGLSGSTGCKRDPQQASNGHSAVSQTPGPSSSGTEGSVPKPAAAGVAAAVAELLAAWEKTPALFAGVETFLPQAAGNKGTTKGWGQYWFAKQDGKLLIYFEVRNVVRMDQEDKSVIDTGEILVYVIDGKHLYTFTNQPGKMKAVKKKLVYEEVLQVGGPHLFRDLVENYNLTLLPEEMVDGRATRVIQATWGDGKLKTIHHFDKATGIRLKMEEKDAEGNTTLLITLRDLDLTSSVSEEKFVFTVPKGVEYVDETVKAP